MLVMTATPIPRTLALTAYADLDLSVIDEMPKTRAAVRTRLVHPSKREAMYEYIREFAARRLDGTADAPALEARHGRYFGAQALGWRDACERRALGLGPDPGAPDRHDWLAAHDRAAARGKENALPSSFHRSAWKEELRPRRGECPQQ